MSTLLLAWFAIFAVLLVLGVGRRGAGGALTIAYFVGLSVIHVPGVLAYLDPSFNTEKRYVTQVGFEIALIGMAAYVAGAIAARQFLRVHAAGPGSVNTATFANVGWRAFGLGVFAYFALIPATGGVPSAVSMVSSLATLMIVGLWLRLYSGALDRNLGRTFSTLAVLPLLPLATLATAGFLGFGVYWALSVISFLFVMSRRRIWFLLVAPAVAFFALSLFVTYMGQRIGIRDVVWREQATFADRLQRISSIATEFQFIDLGDKVHLNALDDRLNQNALVGAGVERHEMGLVSLKHGATVSIAGLIPRAFWPDKPEVGGSGDLVSDFTGIKFREGTSVGVGSVLEFYMNFGVPGVILGFTALGFTMMRLDRIIMRALAAGDVKSLLTHAMPGLVLLQPGGSFLEIIVGAIAAYLTARLVVSFPILGIARPRAASLTAREVPGA